MKKKNLKKSVVAAMITTSLLTYSNVSFANSSIQETIDRAKIDMKNATYTYVKPAENGRVISSQELYQVLNLAKENYQNARSLVIKSDLSNKESVLKELDTLYNDRLTKGLIPYIDAFNYVDKYLNPIMAELKQAESEKDWSELEKAYHKLSVQLNTRTDILYRFSGKVSRDLLLEQYKKPANLKRDQLVVPVTIYMKVKEAETLLALGQAEKARNILESTFPLLEKLPSSNAFPMVVELMKEVDSVSKEAGLVFSIPTPPPSPTSGGNSNNNSDVEDKSSANRAAARVVTALINALPISSKVNVSDGVAILKARAAYEKLTTVQKAMVNITRLTDAEKAFEVVKDKAVNEQAAKVVIFLIESLPTAVDVKVVHEAQIKEARAAYKELTDVQQALVGDITALEEAEQALVIAKEKATSEQAIEVVKTMIANLPLNVTVEDAVQIEAARAAYEALSKDQQAMVDVTALMKAEKALEEAKVKAAAEDKKKAQEAIKLIDAIKKTSTAVKYKKALDDAQTAYKNLTETQQLLVTNSDKLESELADFADVEAEASKLTAGAIGELVHGDNLLNRVTTLLENGYTTTILTSSGEILNGKLIVQPEVGEKAKNGTVVFQVKSPNGTKIERPVDLTVEPKDSSKLAIDAVKSLIAALPAANKVTLKHETQILAARAAYEALSEDQQAMVVNITALTNAEEALEVLKVASDDKEKAQEVVKLITAIKKNNSDYIETLEAARIAYEKLTETQRALVTNSEKLKNELADFRAIKAEASKVSVEAIGVLVDGDNLVNKATNLLEAGYTVTILTSPPGMLKGKQINQPKAGEQPISGEVEFQIKSANGTKIVQTVYLTVEPKEGKQN
jgi:hypothetical protein